MVVIPFQNLFSNIIYDENENLSLVVIPFQNLFSNITFCVMFNILDFYINFYFEKINHF